MVMRTPLRRVGARFGAVGRWLAPALLGLGLLASVLAIPAYSYDDGGGRLTGQWQVTLVIHGAKSHWVAYIHEDRHGHLRGHASPSAVNCHAGVTGSNSGNSLSMVWQVTSSCTSETITFTGGLSHHRLHGTISDSNLGSGTFTAAPKNHDE
jgi:hypothetical protein